MNTKQIPPAIYAEGTDAINKQTLLTQSSRKEIKTMYELQPSKNTVDRTILHGSLMHADDVLCAVIAKMINEDVTIDRLFKVPDESELAPGTLVADVGRGAFDHHQKEVKAQANGHKHASIGLVLENEHIRNALKERGYDLDDPKHAAFFKEIGQIEDLDNGLVGTEGHAISDFCAYMNPVWDSNETPDERFMLAVEMVRRHFVEPYLENGFWPEKDQEIIKAKFQELEQESLEAEQRAAAVVTPALEKMENNVVILPQFAPWDKQLVPSEAEFVIYPSNRGGFNLQCVPPELGSFEKKVELPDWSENMPKGCTFEHPGKFLASFETLEDAVNAAYQIENEKNRTHENEIETTTKSLLDTVYTSHENEKSKEDLKEAVIKEQMEKDRYMDAADKFLQDMKTDIKNQSKTLVDQIRAYVPLKETYDAKPFEMPYDQTNEMKGLKRTIKYALQEWPEDVRPQILQVAAQAAKLSEKQMALFTKEFEDRSEPTRTEKNKGMSFED